MKKVHPLHGGSHSPDHHGYNPDHPKDGPSNGNPERAYFHSESSNQVRPSSSRGGVTGDYSGVKKNAGLEREVSKRGDTDHYPKK